MAIIKDKRTQWAVLSVMTIGFLIWFLFPRGYGKVDTATFQVAQGIYSASLEQNLTRIQRLEELLMADESDIPTHQKRWLLNMIEDAKAGNWKSCTRDARQLLKEQRTYQ